MKFISFIDGSFSTSLLYREIINSSKIGHLRVAKKVTDDSKGMNRTHISSMNYLQILKR